MAYTLELKISCVTVAVYVVRSTICLFVGTRENQFLWLYVYFVEHACKQQLTAIKESFVSVVFKLLESQVVCPFSHVMFEKHDVG